MSYRNKKKKSNFVNGIMRKEIKKERKKVVKVSIEKVHHHL